MSDPATSETSASVESTAAAFRMDGSRFSLSEVGRVVPYNFRFPSFLSDSDLRRLTEIQQKFVQHLGVRLSTTLRMDSKVQFKGFQSCAFTEFSAQLENPTHIALFEAEPLKGIGVLEMGLKTSLAIADRLLGGKGRLLGNERILTEIEVTLVEDVMQVIASEWMTLWSQEGENFQPRFIGYETSGRYLQISAPEAAFVVLDAELSIGEVTDRLKFGVPLTMIEKTIKAMNRSLQAEEEAPAKNLQWRPAFSGITVPVIAEWKAKEMTLRDVVNLKEGEMISLSRDLIHQTAIRVSHTEEFSGTMGTKDGYVAVQVTQKISHA